MILAAVLVGISIGAGFLGGINSEQGYLGRAILGVFMASVFGTMALLVVS